MDRYRYRYRYVAYGTSRLTHPKEMILERCSCDLQFVATPPLQNHVACRRLKDVMSPAPVLRLDASEVVTLRHAHAQVELNNDRVRPGVDVHDMKLVEASR